MPQRGRAEAVHLGSRIKLEVTSIGTTAAGNAAATFFDSRPGTSHLAFAFRAYGQRCMELLARCGPAPRIASGPQLKTGGLAMGCGTKVANVRPDFEGNKK